VCLWVRVAELPASRLCSGECRLRPFGNQARLILGHRREDVNREPVCQRRVGRDKIDITFQKARDHRDASRQPVETGDEKRRAIDAA
jgi:hypothetical protein